MIVLGVTGGIATGKSTVLRMLATLGAPILSADMLARELLLPGTPATREVLIAFPACADGPDTVDRRALGQIVFTDASARHELESILHPPINAALRAQADVWRAQDIALAGALEIPLLFEVGLEDIVDRIMVVTCRPETQILRVAARLDGDKMHGQQWIAAQWPLAEKEARADVVIHTDGLEEDTQRQVEQWWRQIAE